MSFRNSFQLLLGQLEQAHLEIAKNFRREPHQLLHVLSFQRICQSLTSLFSIGVAFEGSGFGLRVEGEGLGDGVFYFGGERCRVEEGEDGGG
ncbi:BQ5605_C050g12495 [Microbotryum silenes-dioicae]|uniref:BQ5605_C050g12495 protein n=1 Tax=Microbotryum silenes-dioicae TaxID=796604 RepID=A0A2X0MP22_9BASI|nr:BQ5605_C050g12495 [Microbotryum silenes-dioicae]